MKLGIVGSRQRNSLGDKELLKRRILELNPSMIISGGCIKGADRFAEELARELGIPITIFHPKLPATRTHIYWIEAYHKRNKQITLESDHLIALVAPGRRGGTENTIMYFKEKLNSERDLEIL